MNAKPEMRQCVLRRPIGRVPHVVIKGRRYSSPFLRTLGRAEQGCLVLVELDPCNGEPIRATLLDGRELGVLTSF